MLVAVLRSVANQMDLAVGDVFMATARAAKMGHVNIPRSIDILLRNV